VLRQNRASRLKIFASVAALCVVAGPIASILLWDQWRLGEASRSLGLDVSPAVLGLIISLVPVYFAAVQIWIPIRLRQTSEEPHQREPMSDAQMHWNAVRLVAIMCILAVEIVAQTVPLHRPAHAAPVGIR